MTKSWLLVDNHWCLMFDYGSMIDFQHAYVFVLFISSLDFDSYLLGMLCSWIFLGFNPFFTELFMFLQVWYALGSNFGFGLFFKSVVFRLVYGWTNDFKSTRLGQIWVRWVRPCLVLNLFYKGIFYLRVCWTNMLLSLFW